MCPHSEHLDSTLVFDDLIHETVLNIDPARVGPRPSLLRLLCEHNLSRRHQAGSLPHRSMGVASPSPMDSRIPGAGKKVHRSVSSPGGPGRQSHPLPVPARQPKQPYQSQRFLLIKSITYMSSSSLVCSTRVQEAVHSAWLERTEIGFVPSNLCHVGGAGFVLHASE